MVRFFLRNGFDVRQRDDDGRTMYLINTLTSYRLHYAAKHSGPAVVKTIIEFTKNMENQKINLASDPKQSFQNTQNMRIRRFDTNATTSQHESLDR